MAYPRKDLTQKLQLQLQGWVDNLQEDPVEVERPLEDRLLQARDQFSLQDLENLWEEDQGYLLPTWWPRHNETGEPPSPFVRARAFARQISTQLDSRRGSKSDASATSMRYRLLRILSSLHRNLGDGETPISDFS